jgi:hypothetical protein
MKKVKNAAKKVKEIQQKVKSLEGKIKTATGYAEHPLRSIGGAVGGKLGSRKGGELVGRFLGKIAGTGDYQVQSNSLYSQSSRIQGDSVPTFVSVGRATRVVHREYLGDVVASSTVGAFQLQSYPINPGLFQSFPWLAGFANQFDEWRPNGIVVCFKSLSSFYSGTSSLGTVVIASDYDVLDSSYTSKVEMENSEFAVSGSAATNLLHPLECRVQERLSNLFYTRSTSVSSTDNLRFFDLCNVQVATAGCTASQVVGELWISYDISLYKPQLYGGISGKNILFSAWNLIGASGANPLGTSNTPSSLNILNNYITISSTAHTITFSPLLSGVTFMCQIWIQGTSAANVAPVLTPLVGSGLSLLPALLGGLSTRKTSGTSADYLDVFPIQIYQSSSGTSPTLTFGTAGTYPTAPTFAAIWFWQINPSA